MKEVNAEILACQNGFSTYEDSALRINGSDFNANVERLEAELKLMSEAGLSGGMAQEGEEEDAEDDTEDDTEDDKDDGKEGEDAEGVSDSDERE